MPFYKVDWRYTYSNLSACVHHMGSEETGLVLCPVGISPHTSAAPLVGWTEIIF